MEAEEFSALFERFERSAFRVEARDRYDVDHERDAFAAFRDGRNLRPRTAANDPWLTLVAAHTAAGRLIERVRIVSEPLTEYTRFELAAYSDNIAAGEKIGIIPRAALTDADQGWASEDFWILDEKLVVLLSYDDTGRFLGAQQPKDIRSYLRSSSERSASRSTSMPSSPSSNLGSSPLVAYADAKQDLPEGNLLTRSRAAERETCISSRTGGRVASAEGASGEEARRRGSRGDVYVSVCGTPRGMRAHRRRRSG